MQRGFAPILIVLLITAVLGIAGVFVFEKHFDKSYLAPDDAAQPITQPTPSPSPKYMNGSISKCGEIPDKAFPGYGHYDIRSGPEWSSDCQHIAWAMWQSGTGCPDCPPATLSDKVGVYVYDAKEKTVKKVFSPSRLDEDPVFLGWLDISNLLFTTGQNKYNYSLEAKKFTGVEN